MRVLQVIDQLNIGGAERVLVDMTNLLALHKVQVDVLVLVRPGPMRKDLRPGVVVRNLERKNKFSLTKLYATNRICSEYDIIHVHLRYNFKYVALAKLLFAGKFNVLLHDHFGDIENDKNIPLGLRWLLRRNRWFAGVSRPLADWAVQSIGLPEDSVFLLPNIVLKKAPRKKTTPDNKILRILHISNFRESKNHTFAFRLMDALRRLTPFRVCFVGQIIDVAYFEKMLSVAKQCNLEDSMSVVNDCDDVQAIMKDFDLAVHTASQESGPLVLIEYLAQTLPFVAYKTGEVSTQINAVIPEFFMNNFEIPLWIERIQAILGKRTDFQGRMEGVFDSVYSERFYMEKCLAIYNRVFNG